MGQKRGRKRTAITPPPDSRVVPGQPEGSEVGLHPPSQPGPSHPQSNSAPASSFVTLTCQSQAHQLIQHPSHYFPIFQVEWQIQLQDG